MLTGQLLQVCLRREVLTDHEVHSQAQRRQLRSVATTEPRRDHGLEAEVEQAKPNQSKTQQGQLLGTSVVRTLKHSFGGSRPWKPAKAEHEARSHPHSGHRRERTKMKGDVSVTTQSSRALETHPLHAQRAEGGDGGATRPRAARERAFGGEARE